MEKYKKSDGPFGKNEPPLKTGYKRFYDANDTSKYEDIKEQIKQTFEEPNHYKIAGLISTKPLVDLILNSDEIKQYNLTPSQYFDLGNWLKYSFRVSKKNQIDSDITKILHYEHMIKIST